MLDIIVRIHGCSDMKELCLAGKTAEDCVKKPKVATTGLGGMTLIPM